MRELTIEQARRFLLAKQGLLGAYRFSGKDGAFAYVRQAGCIQYDPVDVCGKNAELTLQARVKGFRKSMLAALLYKDRLLVDYADKELSIWPTEDWPYFSHYRERSRALGASFAGLAELEAQALAYIRENGPVSSDTLPIEGELFWHSSMHWSGNWHGKSPAARSVLEQLYTDGTLLIHHKNGSRKFYDLAERYLPPALRDAENPCRDADALLRWRMLRRIGAVGLLWNKSSPAFLGINPDAEARRRAFAQLEAAGAVLPARVEGCKPDFYYLAEDEALMQAVLDGSLDAKPRMELLAPLDPLLWDKALIAALWDFQYSWEIYTPADKRKFGYYTLPILWGERFIGRIEAAADRKAGILTVKNVWYEPGVRPTKKLQATLERTIRRFAHFNEVSTLRSSYGEVFEQNPMKQLPLMKRRIIVIGCPGAGKSTFARKLRDLTGLPLYYLDMLFHRPDRTTASREEFDQKLLEIVQTEGWIIDGNYQRTLPLRFEACTDVFFLDYPLEQCLSGAAARIGTVREDMPWVEQEFDPEFRQYILDFQTDQLPRIYDLVEQYRETRQITVFRSRAEADRWLAAQGEGSTCERSASSDRNEHAGGTSCEASGKMAGND